MSHPLRAAIVGCGAISTVHIPIIQSLGRLVAVCDIRADRRNAAAQKTGAAPYSDFDEMLNAGGFDVLHVLTPHDLHAPMSVAALRAGYSVLCEKPMATAREDARAMIETADTAKGQLGVILQNRYNPATRALREIVESGEDGRLLGSRCVVNWARSAPYYQESGWRGQKKREGGSALINQALHTLDLLSYIGGGFARVNGKVATLALPDVIETEDSAVALAEYQSGARALIQVSTGFSCDAPVFLEFALERTAYQIIGDALYRVKDGASAKILENTAPENPGKAYWGSSHRAEIADFYDSVVSGKKFSIGGREAYPVLNLVLAIYESSAENRWVNL